MFRSRRCLLRRPDRPGGPLVMAGNAGPARHLWLRCSRTHRSPRLRAGRGRSVYAFTRTDDMAAQDFCPPARRGVGRSIGTKRPRSPPLDAAHPSLLPAGELVPAALRRGTQGRQGGMWQAIHMSEISELCPYNRPLGGKTAGVGCQSSPARDGLDFLKIAPSGPESGPKTTGISACWSQRSPLRKLRTGQILGAAVLKNPRPHRP